MLAVPSFPLIKWNIHWEMTELTYDLSKLVLDLPQLNGSAGGHDGDPGRHMTKWCTPFVSGFQMCKSPITEMLK